MLKMTKIIDKPGVNTGVEYFCDLAIRSIDKIRDTDPGCKAALAKIANHVWQRINKKQLATVPKE